MSAARLSAGPPVRPSFPPSPSPLSVLSSNIPRTRAFASRTCQRPRAITSFTRPFASSTTRSASHPVAEPALARQHQQLRRVRGERRQHPLQRLSGCQQLLQRARHGCGLAHIERHHPSGGIEGGEAPAAVGADRHPLGRQSHLMVADQRFGRRPGIFAFLHRERRDVDGTAPPGQCRGLLEQRLGPVDMGRIEDRGRQLGSLQRLSYQLQPAPAAPHVEVHDAGLGRHESAHMGVARHPQQLIQRRLAGAVVADGELAYADDQIDQDDIAPHAAGDRRRREMVPSGVAPGAQSLLN